MASGTLNGRVTYNSSSQFFGCNWSSSGNISTNKSTLTINMYYSTSNVGKKWDTVGTRDGYIHVYINDTLVHNDTFSMRIDCDPYPSNPYTIHSTSCEISHNNDGAPPNVRVEAYMNGTASSGGTQYGPGKSYVDITPITLDHIPRYANFTSFSVNKRDETSLNVTWSADASCDYAWYRIRQSGGSYGNWIGGVGTNFNITGLAANTTYIVQMQIRRQDSQLVTPSGEVRQTTYAYPYINSVGVVDMLIGEQQTLKLYNPLKRLCTVYMKKDNISGTELYSGTTTNETFVFTPDSQTLYNSTPDATISNAVYYCVYSGNTSDTQSGTYRVNIETDTPILDDLTYQYTSDSSSLTGDNTTVIADVSTITFDITHGATAQHGATIASYTITWGSSSDVITDISNSGTLTPSNSEFINITAYDSRGLSSTQKITISDYIAYYKPTNLRVLPHRLNGIGETSYVDISGTIYYDTFGSEGESNEITDIKYYVDDDDQHLYTLDISGITYSQQSSQNHSQKFTIEDAPIYENGSSGGFNTEKVYMLTFIITDTSGASVSIYKMLNSGHFAEDWYMDGNGQYHNAINGRCMEDYTLSVWGNIYADNVPEKITRVRGTMNDFYYDDGLYYDMVTIPYPTGYTMNSTLVISCRARFYNYQTPFDRYDVVPYNKDNNTIRLTYESDGILLYYEGVGSQTRIDFDVAICTIAVG